MITLKARRRVKHMKTHPLSNAWIKQNSDRANQNQRARNIDTCCVKGCLSKKTIRNYKSLKCGIYNVKRGHPHCKICAYHYTHDLQLWKESYRFNDIKYCCISDCRNQSCGKYYRDMHEKYEIKLKHKIDKKIKRLSLKELTICYEHFHKDEFRYCIGLILLASYCV